MRIGVGREGTVYLRCLVEPDALADVVVTGREFFLQFGIVFPTALLLNREKQF